MATPGGPAGRMAVDAVTKGSLKKKASLEMSGGFSGWDNTGQLDHITSSWVGEQFGSPAKHQAGLETFPDKA